MSANNTENLRTWFRRCPLLEPGNRFGVDYLPESPTEYAVISVPTALKYHENILGEEVLDDIQIQNFIFAAKNPYGSDIRQNLENLGFFQGIVNWILEQNASLSFPDWDGGTVRSIVPTLTGAPIQTGSDVARYQIQLRVTYRR